jgi:membrane-associated phospholipid phosphatase
VKELKKYKHLLIIPIYGFFYLLAFNYLEKTVTSSYHEIHMWLDDYIPFCELFIVPYLLWFLYVAVTIGYFAFNEKVVYWKLVIFLFAGMTVFLIVSYVYPNGHYLRPEVFPRDNIFTNLVKTLYAADTPTNILPSIHVYNSIGAHIAIAKSKRLSKNYWIKGGSFLLMILIIGATVFLKQHSMIDVITGTLMAVIFYLLIFKVNYVSRFNRGKMED